MMSCSGFSLCIMGMLVFLVAMELTEGKISGVGEVMAFNKGYSSSSTMCDGGLIGECYPEEGGMLATRRLYISYEALKADAVPCGKTGTSYYNCRDTGPANPYKRACTVITRCARDTS